MKKLFLVVLAAGLFAACGNKTNAPEAPATDTTVVEAVVDTPVVEEAPVVEEVAAPAQASAAQKTTKPAEKTVKETAVDAGENVAKEAIKAVETEATQQLQTKKRR